MFFYNQSIKVKEKKIDFRVYELISEGESIIVETFDSKVVDSNKYNYNHLYLKLGLNLLTITNT